MRHELNKILILTHSVLGTAIFNVRLPSDQVSVGVFNTNPLTPHAYTMSMLHSEQGGVVFGKSRIGSGRGRR